MDAHFDARSARSVPASVSRLSPPPPPVDESWQMHHPVFVPVIIASSSRSTPTAHSVDLPPVEHHYQQPLAAPQPVTEEEEQPRSSFSPVSPKFAPLPRWPGSARHHDVEFGDPRSAPLPPHARAKRRKCSDILFSWRVGLFGQRKPPRTTFETWGPTGDVKITTTPPPKQHKWRDRLIVALLVLLLIYLLSNAVFVDIKISQGSFNAGSGGSGSSSGSSSSSSGKSTGSASPAAATLSAAETQCLFQFNLSAPLAPTLYPCSTCVPTLSAIPSAYLSAHAQDAQVASDAQQFCGLQAVFNVANQTALQAVGWMSDNSYCTWSGVSCDGSARVTTLSMAFPAIPATLPDGLGALTGLTSLQIVGNGTSPSGALPAALGNATKLTSLHLEATGLGPLTDALLSNWLGLTALTLIRNPNMGTSLPQSLGENALQTLVVNQQGLTSFILLSSSNMAGALTTLDLSANALSGPVFALFGAFSALKVLRLSDNGFTGPLPSLSGTLQTLALDHNPQFGGFSLPASLCGSAQLTSCDMRDTLFSNQTTAPSCGPCLFN